MNLKVKSKVYKREVDSTMIKDLKNLIFQRKNLSRKQRTIIYKPGRLALFMKI